MIPYPAYKSTDLPWLPKIPEHWECSRIKNLFSLRDERNYEDLSKVNLISVYTNLGVVQHCDIIETTGNRAVNADGYKRVYRGDIVVNIILCWMGAMGKSNYDGVTSPAYDVYRPKANISVNYYHFLFRTNAFCGECKRQGHGIMMMRWRTYSKDFLTIPIPLPPPNEQEQIVRYLDSMTAKINKLVRAKKKQIALLQEQRQAIINQAVTKGLDPNAEMKDSGIDWLGKIPKEWRCPHLSFLTTKIGSGKTPKGGAEIYQESGVRFIRSQNVYFNQLVEKNLQYISESIDATMPSTRVLKDDVLLNITGASIGRCCVYRSGLKANVNQHVCIIRCQKNLILPDYLASVLYSHIGQEAITRCQNEGNRESLTFPQIGAFFIPLPSIEEQKRILASIDGKTRPIEDTIERINKEIDLLGEYKQSLVSSVVTGQIDVRNIPVEDVIPDDLIAEDDPTSEIEDEPTNESEEM